MAQRDDARLAARGEGWWTTGHHFYVLAFFSFYPGIFYLLFLALLLIITYQFKLEYMYGAGNDNGEVARVARDNERQIGARNASVDMFFLALLSGYFQLDYV